MPEIVEDLATHENESVRFGVLKTVAILVNNHVGDVDKAVKSWVSAATARRIGTQLRHTEELTQIVKICHSYLRGNFGSSRSALHVIDELVRQVIDCLETQIDIRRELLALIKTAAWRTDDVTRQLAARWILAALDKIDVSLVREGYSFTKQALGMLIERKNLSFEDIMPRIQHWKAGTLRVVVARIVSHHPDKQNSALLDDILLADEGEGVRSTIIAYRLRDQ
jgi:hypothetical protein